MVNLWAWVSILPLLLILTIIGSILYAYLTLHLIRTLSQDVTDKNEEYEQAAVDACVVGYLSFMLLLNYVLAILTDPGKVPSDYVWTPEDFDTSAHCSVSPPRLQEKKRSGERRHCKWCGKYKPDRTHHCRICQRCVLKMDHHCPWIANCVGWRNHKYFFLVVIYSLLDCYYIAITMWPIVQEALNKWEMTMMSRFSLIFAETLAVVSCGPLTIFLAFHGWLMFNGLTTIEFCEKSVRGNDSKSFYDYGLIGNVRAVLGPNPLLWPFPVNFAVGTGISFETSAVQDEEADASEEKESSQRIIRQEPEWTGQPASSQ